MSNQLATTTSSNSLEEYITSADPFSQMAAAFSTQGETIKFSKGHWLVGRGHDEVEVNGKRMTADLESLAIGWRCWKEKRIVDERIGLVADNYRPPQRNDLGDLDESKWERDANGVPKDPWVLGFFLTLVDPETEQSYVWTATSYGGKKEVGRLVTTFTRQRKKEPGRCTPIVELASDFYRHATYGRVDVPVLKVVDWEATSVTPSIPAPDGSDDAEMNDSMPF